MFVILINMYTPILLIFMYASVWVYRFARVETPVTAVDYCTIMYQCELTRTILSL